MRWKNPQDSQDSLRESAGNAADTLLRSYAATQLRCSARERWKRFGHAAAQLRRYAAPLLRSYAAPHESAGNAADTLLRSYAALHESAEDTLGVGCCTQRHDAFLEERWNVMGVLSWRRGKRLRSVGF